MLQKENNQQISKDKQLGFMCGLWQWVITGYFSCVALLRAMFLMQCEALGSQTNPMACKLCECVQLALRMKGAKFKNRLISYALYKFCIDIP